MVLTRIKVGTTLFCIKIKKIKYKKIDKMHNIVYTKYIREELIKNDNNDSKMGK